MKRIFKRTLSVFLALIMVSSVIPFTVFAEDEPEAQSNTETEFSSEGGMGKIINNLTENEEKLNFFVSEVTVMDKKVTVEYSASADCKMVVAIYNEKTLKMLGSGVTDVTKEEKGAEVEINIEKMPDTFLVKVFLLGANNEALCKPFSNYKYTSAYEEFLEKTPDDYKDDRVIPFDEKAEDFGVLEDNVTAPETSSKMTFTYNSETLTFVFENAIDEVKNLKVGELFYYEYGEKESDFILLKVKEITVSGSKVTVVEDENISLQEAFKFLRIDENADFSDVNNEDVELGSCLEADTSKASSKLSYDLEPYSFKAKLSYPESEDDDKEAWKKGFKVEGSLNYTIKGSVRLYYDATWGPDYYEFKVELEHSIYFNVSASGEIEVNTEKVGIKLPPVPVGPFEISVKAYPVISFSGEISIALGVNVKNTMYATHDSNGLQTNNDTWTTEPTVPDDIAKIKLEFKLGLGVEATGKLGKGVFAAISIALEAGGKFSAEIDTVGLWTDKYHDCYFCLDGSISIFVEGKMSAELKFFKEDWSLEFEPIKIGAEYFFNRFHISWSRDGFKLALGECDRIENKVTVTVVNENSQPIEDITLSTTTGRCDAHGDKKFDDTATKVDSNGQAVFYFRKGQHTITAHANATGYKDGSVSFNIIGVEKAITIKLSKATSPDAPEIPDIPVGGVLTGNEKTGDIIEFGSYPQTRVTDASLLSSLNSLSKTWVSYGYYTGDGGQMKSGDWMKYADATYGGNKYRAVTFSQYRPWNTGEKSSAGNSHQDDNGYSTNTVYWFKYEPLKWRVLDAEEGLVMCENIIDSQAYSNTLYYKSGYHYNSTSCTNYASDYAASTIREWLNEDFYNIAFTSNEKSAIGTTTLDNSCYSTSYPELDSATTNDKIFLLSWDEARNTSYGFSSGTGYDKNKEAKGTDYAKCQGLYVYKSSGSSYNGNSYWHLRSPGYVSYSSCCVDGEGNMYSDFEVISTSLGIRPAFKFNLSTAISRSYTEEANSNGTVANNGTVTESTKAFEVSNDNCISENDYILINVTGYGEKFELTSENLLYIDQLTADSTGKVKTSFIPKSSESNSTTLLIGDFGNGVEVKEVVTSAITTITSLEIATLPTKTEYHAGDKLDTTGLKVKITYSNGKVYTFSNDVLTCTPEILSETGKQKITVKYKTATCTFDVDVFEHFFGEWETTKEPTDFNDGLKVRTCSVCGEKEEDIVLKTGVTVTLTDSDGQVVMTSVIEGNSEKYKFSGLEDGKYTATFSRVNHVIRSYEVIISGTDAESYFDLNLIGDINGDDKVNTVDVARANSHAKKVAYLTDYYLACADVNGDGKVNTIDVARMNSHAKNVTKLW